MINNEIKLGLVRQLVRKGKYQMVYQAHNGQMLYKKNRVKSVRKITLDKATKDMILHYHKQKFSPEMMVKAKRIPATISSIYYWNHHGHLGLISKADLPYPRK